LSSRSFVAFYVADVVPHGRRDWSRSITDLQKVTGIGSGTNYADIAPLITVADAAAPSAPPIQPPDTSTSTPPDVTASPLHSVGGGSPQYAPIPALRLVLGGNRTVASGAEIAFTATVYDAEANKRDDAIVTWSFGDGMQRTGSSVLHTFYAPGEYAVNVHASTADGGDASASITIAAKDAGIAITAVSPRGITLTNADVSALDLPSGVYELMGESSASRRARRFLANIRYYFRRK